VSSPSTSRARPPEPTAALVRAEPVIVPAIVVPPALRRYTKDLRRWRPGNEVALLRAGAETFPAMLDAIASARRTIHFETYIIQDDRTGQRFSDALIERARAGVAVRLVYDAVGALELGAGFVARLREAGVEVVEYRPIAPWRRRWGWLRRDHRKIVVVDDEVAFTGGINIADDYADAADGGKGWHDIHCQVRGPIVLDLSRSFRRVWLREGGAVYPAPPRPEAMLAEGPVVGRMLDNSERRRRRVFRRAYVRAINAARESVYLENAYFLPDRGVRAALYRAVRRGVDVAVIVPGNSDVKAIEFAGLYVYRRLTRRGVRILSWRGPMMHAKTAVVDGAWSTIGSYNLDHVSLHQNLEVTVEVLDTAHGQVMVDQFQRDAARCDAFDPELWQRLPWWKKALAALAFRFRRWL